jgi:hypothetical protein
MTESPNAKISSLLDELAPRLSEEEVDEIRELLEKDEEDAALEALCEEIYENDVRILSETYESIAEIGEELELDPSVWEAIQDLVLPED